MRSHSKSWQTALRVGIITAGILGGSFENAPAVRADTLTIIRQEASMDKLIEGLMAEIRTSKSLPRWAIDAAMNAYAIYKTYRNGEKVEEINATVFAILKEIATIKANAEIGREITEREIRLSRELLDSYASRLAGYEQRVASVELDVKHIRKWLELWGYQNRMCRGEDSNIFGARERR